MFLYVTITLACVVTFAATIFTATTIYPNFKHNQTVYSVYRQCQERQGAENCSYILDNIITKNELPAISLQGQK